MLQIVHDIAPGASLSFATAFLGEASFASNIHALANAGADIIGDDIIYFNEPFYQDGLVAKGDRRRDRPRRRLLHHGLQLEPDRGGPQRQLVGGARVQVDDLSGGGPGDQERQRLHELLDQRDRQHLPVRRRTPARIVRLSLGWGEPQSGVARRLRPLHAQLGRDGGGRTRAQNLTTTTSALPVSRPSSSDSSKAAAAPTATASLSSG